MPAPATLARLLQLAEIAPSDTVLAIGATTGYAVAVLAGMAAEVVGVEFDAGLVAGGAARLAAASLANCSLVAGPVARLGAGRFDVVLVEGALDTVPADYLAALGEGGRLVAVIGTGGVSVAHVFVKADGKVTARADFDAALPALFAPSGDEPFRF
jgi:protein-L-isoaspartate(D-aspartate) O-methyltransferase